MSRSVGCAFKFDAADGGATCSTWIDDTSYHMYMDQMDIRRTFGGAAEGLREVVDVDVLTFCFLRGGGVSRAGCSTLSTPVQCDHENRTIS